MNLQPVAGLEVLMRLYLLHMVAKALGLLVKVDGIPYGRAPQSQVRMGSFSHSEQL